MGHIFFFFFFIISITYPQTVLETIELADNINETSGLEVIDDYLITLNDSGNPPILFYLNDKGEVVFERNFNELKNIDWEDIATDDEFIYIADIGNNFDTRDNLQIIKVPIDPNINSYELINFYYPEQKDFSFKRLSMYDAEGLISFDNNLLVFTKNRAKKITEIYRIPKKPGNYKAKLIGQIDIESIVTAADYNEKNQLLVLTSTFDFNKYNIIKIENFNLSKINNIQIKKFEIPIGKTQVEAIKIIDENNFWITSEAELFGSPKIYKISL